MARPHYLAFILLANGCVALLTSGVALLVLLIAPLGLTAVITCTALVAILSFTGGVVADVVLWRLLPVGRVRRPASGQWRSGRTAVGSGGSIIEAGRPPRLPRNKQR